MALCPAPALAAEDVARHVNPFVGTTLAPIPREAPGWHSSGQTFPGAVAPFGMVQWSPDTNPGALGHSGGYTYGDPVIRGLSLKHLSGAGCPAYQDVSLLPIASVPERAPTQPLSADLHPGHHAAFSHARESASPGYYRVTLRPGEPEAIGAELTATRRTGLGRFTYPRGASEGVMLVNAASSAMGTPHAEVLIDPRRRRVTGWLESGNFCGAGGHYRLHFALEFDRPFTRWGTWRRDALSPGAVAVSDSEPRAALNFIRRGANAQPGAYVAVDTRRDRALTVRAAVSFVSVRGALRNLRAESRGPGFDAVQRDARSSWNRVLRRVLVRGGRRSDVRTFYTALYHALIHPTTVSDADGRYRGMDGRVHRARGWVKQSDISGWDVYRSQIPLLALLAPRQASDLARSLVADARQSGALPKWALANAHTGAMVGDPADQIIAGADAFGARGFDRRAALRVMVAGATRYPPAGTFITRPGLGDYLRLGYVPHDLDIRVDDPSRREAVWGSAATTLEYAGADFAISRLAARLGERRTCRTFLRRAAGWRLLVNAASGYIEPRYRGGEFLAGTNPTSDEGFVEGSASQYRWMVPHDPRGLFQALGGAAVARERLDDFFTELNAGPGSTYAWLGNQPSLGIPWLYDWARAPHRTQAVVRRALLELFGPGPGGLPGNDDLGTLSAWYVFSALGLYPAIPGTDVLALGSPLFRSARVRLARGVLRIEAPRAARGRPYVHGLRLDGRPYARPWLRARRVARGATLRFDLGAAPSERWGRAVKQAPPSFPPDAACG